MRKTDLLTLLITVLLGATLAGAQASRTWISGTGDDINPCSRTLPCKTFAGAQSKTAAGGEINALNPGGYGAITITKAITIDGGGGQVAGVLVTGIDGIVVKAGPSDVVILRNLRIDGVGSGINGIRWLSGKGLHVQHTHIFGFTNHAIDIEKSDGGQAFVTDVEAVHNGGCGVLALNTVTNVEVTIADSKFNGNLCGPKSGDFSTLSITNTEASGNTFGYIARSDNGTSDLNIVNSIAANNSDSGIYVGAGASTSTARITGVSLFNNGIGLSIHPNGTLSSFGNNYNANGGAPNGAPLLPQ